MKNKFFSNAPIHIMLILGGIAMALPFIWMILTSGKTLVESTQIPPTIFPEKFQLSNYQQVLDFITIHGFLYQYIFNGCWTSDWLGFIFSNGCICLCASKFSREKYPFQLSTYSNDDCRFHFYYSTVFISTKIGYFKYNSSINITRGS